MVAKNQVPSPAKRKAPPGAETGQFRLSESVPFRKEKPARGSSQLHPMRFALDGEKDFSPERMCPKRTKSMMSSSLGLMFF